MTRRPGLGAWDFLSGSGVYNASSNVSLLSSSLPVLPHQKCMYPFTTNLINILVDHIFSDPCSFAQKVIINDNGGGHKSTDDDISTFNTLKEDVQTEDSLKDISSKAMGYLLPDNEDELLAGIIDYGLSAMPPQLDKLEETDLFDSVGGMELENEMQQSLNMGVTKLNLSDGAFANGMAHCGPHNDVGTIAGEHPYGEHPSRTLFVRNINSHVEDGELKTLFEQYGDIRTLYTACKHRGFVMISFYDIRDARAAMRALQNKPLRQRKLDIHFSIPKDNPSEKDINQGTLVIFNLDPAVSNEDLCQIFGAYGEVKEIRETPHKKHHKFIEFYDVRSADAALRALNRIDIAGKRIKLEPSRPGGTRRNLLLQLNQELDGDESHTRHHIGSPLASSPPGNWLQFSSPIEHSTMHAFSRSPGYRTLSPMASSLPGLASILHSQPSNSVKGAPFAKDPTRGSHINHLFSNSYSEQRPNFQQPHSFPELKLGPMSSNVSSFGTSTSIGSGFETFAGPQFLWGSSNTVPEKPEMTAWSNFSDLHPWTSNGQSQGQGFTYQTQPHVGSAPSGIHFERHFGFFAETPETSNLNLGTFGGLNLGGLGNGNYMMNVGPPRTAMHGGIGGNISENGSSPAFRMMSSPGLSPVFLGNGPYPGMTFSGGEAEHWQSPQVENNVNQTDSKMQFQIDMEKIASGGDTRTTLMIKNISNKYTSEMLLDAIDENNKGTYDFLYLPIDFKNKCNYAFINMLSPLHIIPFYEAFNGKKWEKFSREKVATLAYARIQGREALIAHFQNSSLMNEDKRCRPILFHNEGIESGEQIIQEHLPSSGLNSLVWATKGSSEFSKSSGSITWDGLEQESQKAQYW